MTPTVVGLPLRLWLVVDRLDWTVGPCPSQLITVPATRCRIPTHAELTPVTLLWLQLVG